MRKHCLLALCLSFCTAAAWAGEPWPEAWSAKLGRLLECPAAARGDAGGEIETCLRLAEEAPETPVAEIALRWIRAQDALYLPPTEAWEERLARYMAQPNAHGPAVDQARMLLAKWAVRKGRFENAAALGRDAGEIMDWRVIGPFGRYEAASFFTPFPPEEGLRSLAEPLPGTWGKNEWRPIRPDPFSGRLQPFAAIYPYQNATLYLLTQVKSPSEQDAFLHLETAHAWVLWLNGARAAEADRLASYLPRESYAPLRLAGGWNRLLLKLYAPDTERTVRIRLTDGQGLPLRSVEVRSGPDLYPLPSRPAALPAPQEESGAKNPGRDEPGADKGERPLRPAGALAAIPSPGAPSSPLPQPRWALPVLEAAAEDRPADWALQAARAFLLSEQDLPDRAIQAAEAALEAAPGKPCLHTLLADILQSADHLPLEVRANRSRHQFKAALAADPQSVGALLGLAELDWEDQGTRPALFHLERALAVNPGCVRAQRLRINIALEKGWLAEAEAWCRALSTSGRGTLALPLLQARLFSKLRRASEEAAACAEALETDRSQRLLWILRLRALEDTDDPEGAAALARALARAAPDNPLVLAQAADHFFRFGPLAEGLDFIARASSLLPENPSLWRLKGEILLRLGRREEAASAFRESLARQPSQYDLLRLIGELEAKPFDFWSAYAIDADRAMSRDEGERHSGPTARLIDQTVLEIYPDGAYAEMMHELQKVLTRDGITAAREVPIYGELMDARTRLPYQQTLEPIRLKGQPVLTMPGLTPGAAVEYRFFYGHPPRPDYSFDAPCWYFRSPDTSEEFVLTQYVIRVPEGFPFAYVQRNFDTPPSVETDKGMTVYTWTMRNMPRVREEKGSPHINEFLPYVEAGSPLRWEEVAREVENNYLGRLRPTVELEALVDRLVRDARDPRERLERLRRYVLDSIKETPLSGEASIVQARQSGSRLVLLMALLRMAGLDARWAAVRPAPEFYYEANWELPRAELFPLALLAVFLPGEEEPTWVDVRYRAARLGDLVEDLSGATAFVVRGPEGVFHTLPRLSPSALEETEEIRLVLRSEDESGKLEGTRVVRGLRGAEILESLFETLEGERIRRLERRLAPAFPLVTTLSLETSGSGEFGLPYRETYVVEVEGILSAEGQGSFSLGLGLAPLDLVKEMDREQAERQNPFHLSRPEVRNDRITILLPKGFRLAQSVPDLLEKDVFGAYSLTVREADGEIRVERRYSFLPQIVAAKDWPRFAALTERIRTAEKGRILLRGTPE
ncbi:MAG: tetratricopeptide repeat protein [Planctomycetota bacterium]